MLMEAAVVSGPVLHVLVARVEAAVRAMRVPSIIGFVSEPADTTMPARRAVVAETIAAFIDDITRVKPWSIWDTAMKTTRPARPGDVAILVRKMTPDFIAPYEDGLRARQVSYRLVGGKEYFVRDEVRALAAVLRAIDNPADRLSLVQALRSPFFAVSDADLLRFASSGGVLNINAPQRDDVKGRDVLDPAFTLLARLHRLRRIESPSVIVEEIFARTRALAAFLMKPSGAQMVANLWKVLETARAYEAAAPATLRAFVRFLQDEEASSRAEGDSPVGEPIGASVEIVTVQHGRFIIDHAGKQGWLKIGRFAPAGWKARQELERAQEDAEGRRLFYVALTRARDHLVVPCLPGEPVKSWLGPVANVLVRDVQKVPFGKREGPVTWFDSRRLAFGVHGPSAPAYSAAVEGPPTDARKAQALEQAWLDARRAVRKQAKQVTVPVVHPSAMQLPPTEADTSDVSSAQRLFGTEDEAAAARAELSVRSAGDSGAPLWSAGSSALREAGVRSAGALAPAADEPAAFGRYVHEILARVDLSGANLEPVAGTLARQHGMAEAAKARAVAMVDRVLKLPLMDDARAATYVFREVPLAGPDGSGEQQGRADLLFEHGGQWRVVEFKTGPVAGDEAVKGSGDQLSNYARRLTAVVSAPVRPTLCLVALPEVLAL